MTWPIATPYPILGRAATPTRGAPLTLPQIRAALKAGGRKRNLDKTARRIQKSLRGAHLTAPGPVADAYGTTVASLVNIIVETNRQITDLQATLQAHFEEHPDADIYHSQPRLGTVLGARTLAECSRFAPERYTRLRSYIISFFSGPYAVGDLSWFVALRRGVFWGGSCCGLEAVEPVL